ncbi:hypothetical protein P7L70_03085 (plasmid) [Tistrella mobilis]|uniref:hypothetical protein n=1 Tax=Tistrella mobilis TaxID=171437 RepID=UPI003555DECE
MDEQQLSNAVTRYATIRKRLVEYDSSHKDVVEKLVKNSVAARKLKANGIWQILWPLPFYSGVRATCARRRENAARNGGWFDDYRHFVNGANDPQHDWHVTTEGQYRVAIGQWARDFCGSEGKCADVGIRTSARVIQRICRLADVIAACEEESDDINQSFLYKLSKGDPSTPEAFQIAKDKLAPAIGNITALHALMDLGFQTVKPDKWLCRLAVQWSWIEGYNSADLEQNRRNGHQALTEACQKIASAAAGTFPSANPIRELDYYVANYGMNMGNLEGDHAGQPRHAECRVTAGE